MQLPFQDCAKKISYSDVPWHIAQLAALEATLGQFASHRTWGALDVEGHGIFRGGTRVPNSEKSTFKRGKIPIEVKGAAG